MSFGVLGDLNWFAVIVAAIIYFALGAIWYMPGVFGKPWMRSVGWDATNEQPPMTPAMYLGPFVAYVAAVIAIGMIAFSTGSDTVGEGVVLGLVAGVGIAGTLTYVTAVFDPQKVERMTWFAVTAAYHFVGVMIASILLAVWD